MRTDISQPHVFLACLFCGFWLATLAPAASSSKLYLYRTAVVVFYSFLSWADHHKTITGPEWLADGLVWSHFVSLISVFVYGDPRFPRRKKRA